MPLTGIAAELGRLALEKVAGDTIVVGDCGSVIFTRCGNADGTVNGGAFNDRGLGDTAETLLTFWGAAALAATRVRTCIGVRSRDGEDPATASIAFSGMGTEAF